LREDRLRGTELPSAIELLIETPVSLRRTGALDEPAAVALQGLRREDQAGDEALERPGYLDRGLDLGQALAHRRLRLPVLRLEVWKFGPDSLVVRLGGTVRSDPSLERLELDPGKRVALPSGRRARL
jgi:hypothetical protein